MSRKLGGEFRDLSRGRDYSAWDARRLFLEAIADVAPEIPESLIGEVYGLYQRARVATQPEPSRDLVRKWRTWAAAVSEEPSSLRGALAERNPRFLPPMDPTPILRPWQRWSFASSAWREANCPELQALRESLGAWARSFPRRHWRTRMSLEVPWYLDAALDTLTHFDLSGDRNAIAPPRFIDTGEGTPFTLRLPPPVSRKELERLLRDLKSTSEPSREDPTGREDRTRARGYFRPAFRHPPWLPQFKPARTYTREVTQAFERYTAGYGGASEAEKRLFRRALREYMAVARHEARRAGWEPSPHMRADSAEKAEDDEALRAFKRLALYFAGNHPTEIATAEHVDESTVRKSNSATAHLLGLSP